MLPGQRRRFDLGLATVTLALAAAKTPTFARMSPFTGRSSALTKNIVGFDSVSDVVIGCVPDRFVSFAIIGWMHFFSNPLVHTALRTVDFCAICIMVKRKRSNQENGS